jgi:uncharacterized protein YfaS (alpha-2-macroglobulin family)
MIRKKYTLGNLVRINIDVRDPDAVLINATSVVLDIVDPAGSDTVSGGSFTNESTGIYYYDFQSSTSDPAGVYTVKITVTTGANVSKKNIELIELRDTVDA